MLQRFSSMLERKGIREATGIQESSRMMDEWIQEQKVCFERQRQGWDRIQGISGFDCMEEMVQEHVRNQETMVQMCCDWVRENQATLDTFQQRHVQSMQSGAEILDSICKGIQGFQVMDIEYKEYREKKWDIPSVWKRTTTMDGVRTQGDSIECKTKLPTLKRARESNETLHEI